MTTDDAITTDDQFATLAATLSGTTPAMLRAVIGLRRWFLRGLPPFDFRAASDDELRLLRAHGRTDAIRRDAWAEHNKREELRRQREAIALERKRAPFLERAQDCADEIAAVLNKHGMTIALWQSWDGEDADSGLELVGIGPLQTNEVECTASTDTLNPRATAVAISIGVRP